MKINKFSIKMIVMLSFLFITTNIFALNILKNVVVNRKNVYLSDIILTTDTDQYNKSKKVLITELNEPGSIKEINGDYISLKLRSITNEKLVIPNKIIIKRNFEYIEKIKLKKIILEKVEEIYNNENYYIEVIINGGNKIKITKGKKEYELESTRLKDKKLGKYRVALNIVADNEVQQKIYFILDVKAKLIEYRLKENVKKGELFTLDKVEKREKYVYYKSYNNIIDIDKIKTMIYKNDFYKNHILSNSDFEIKKLIKKGERVKIKVNYNGIKIEDVAIAMEDGIEGQTIEVKNLRSNKIFYGKVSESGEILVEK
ncbi:flagella basal body P-ring formation protein FlgA [Hypnocyclicus thermotrophus]|uniref:Flagella basal body P-ring formation protein FlgA n=1 Tax=Hypnocyclicus thermotrophus TaxID=1627895 RepID=A0AA46I618_9FUSO|nr:flagellar basal body P-ring formation chaperone FlgA [Hypnocyclicus thermotrophus]TDT71565.1 flagella basal body P-ring formation protein FlgA [Hypnocyclicus thermotrophus]